jgi:hypothetical protein
MKPDRKAQLLEAVYLALGSNRVERRWIKPYRERGQLVSVEGLADKGVITVSGLTEVPCVVHECLHRAFPAMAESAIERATTFLFARMTDAECKRLYDAYSRKARAVKTPVSSE